MTDLTSMDDIAKYNRQAWDQLVDKGNQWTRPVTSDQIQAARKGQWSVVLTPERTVPGEWLAGVQDLEVLALASGGGQQTPILSAAGANVTVIDNSPGQLKQDQAVADREGLSIRTELGDMRDLSRFQDKSFDLVFNPCSIGFVPDVQPVFDEVARVLRPGGRLMCGFTNPVRFVFDEDAIERDAMQVRHVLPYADETHLTEPELEKLRAEGEPFLFSHTLEGLIGGQLQAGMIMIGFYEDRPESDYASKFFASYFATCFKKPM
ncbi:MAG: class I SAM-dependent methyltransferase [Planctomycetota bacterium]